jgi:ACT domain-containing protein
MDAELRVAHQKLSVLQLAESLRNVSEACRQRGVSRTQFYEYKRRFEGPTSDPQIQSLDHSARAGGADLGS